MNATTVGRALAVSWIAAMVLCGVPAKAAAKDPSVEEMIEALAVKPEPPRTRGMRMRGIGPARGPAEPGRAGSGKLQLAVQFEFDSAKVSPESRELLRKLASAMKSEALAKLRFRIEGHTDSVGGGAYNLRLSERRANAVQEFLRAEAGIEASRLESIGMGSAKPANPDDPRAAVNRRVLVVSLEPMPAQAQAQAPAPSQAQAQAKPKAAVPPAAKGADGAAGTVERLSGQLQVRRAQSNTALEVGARVREGDVLVTAAETSALVRLDDGANLLLRASSMLRVEKLRLAGDPSTWKQAFSLVMGAFRYVTGALGGNRPEAVAFNTAMATVGIRGTDIDIVHTEAGAGGGEAGTYVKVNKGAVSLDGVDGSRVDLAKDEQAYAGPRRPATRGGKPPPAAMRLTAPADVFKTGELDDLLEAR